MRKVFLWSILLGRYEQTSFISDDFELPTKQYGYSMTYILDMNSSKGDDVVVVTATTGGALAQENYSNFVKEATSVLKDKGVNFDFVEVVQSENFEGHTINRFFKEIAQLVKDNDKMRICGWNLW